MQAGEKQIAIESIIYEFAKNQFASNGISPMEAQAIIKCVLAEFQGMCIERFVLDRVQMSPPSQEKTEDNTKETCVEQK